MIEHLLYIPSEIKISILKCENQPAADDRYFSAIPRPLNNIL